MEPIEVTALFDLDGRVTPRKFVWRGGRYPVESTGRHWQDGDDLHILVMVSSVQLPGQVYELVFRPGESRWYMARPPAGTGLA